VTYLVGLAAPERGALALINGIKPNGIDRSKYFWLDFVCRIARQARMSPFLRPAGNQ